jgi:hypothetical protein
MHVTTKGRSPCSTAKHLLHTFPKDITKGNSMLSSCLTGHHCMLTEEVKDSKDYAIKEWHSPTWKYINSDIFWVIVYSM